MLSIREKLWAKVVIPDNLDACWIWNGALSHKRRGQRRPIIRVGDKVKHVARVVCEWVNGPPPTPRHQAGHTCPGGENELCVSPRHLVWMTPLENQSVKSGKFRPRSTSTISDMPASPTTSPLQRLLREACAGSCKLIARVIKARAQRDGAREEARQNCANIVLSMAHALRQQNRISAGYVQDSHATDAALARVEEFLGLPADGTQGERIERISRARRGILRKGLEHPLHYQEYQISPQEIQASVGYLVEATRRRLVEDFVAQGHTPRTIVVRVQDW